MKIYEYCNDCPHSSVFENGLKDDDGWTSNMGSRACTHAEVSGSLRHAGAAFAFNFREKPPTLMPAKTRSPNWCPLKQENFMQRLAEATEKAKKYGGKLIAMPLDPKRCVCKYQEDYEDPNGAFINAEGSCYACIHSFYVTIDGANFYCCKHNESK